MATATQLLRRKSSDRTMTRRGYRVFDGPLYCDDDNEAVIRSPEQTLRRAMILWLLGCCADGSDRDSIRRSMERCGLISDLSPSEAEYMAEPTRDLQTDTDMKWRLEASWVLLWALRRMWWLNWPSKLCDCRRMTNILAPYESAFGLQHAFWMRSKTKILDTLDLTLRQHWAARDDYLRGIHKLPPIFGRVAQQRHHALLWLTSTTTWDDVQTHT